MGKSVHSLSGSQINVAIFGDLVPQGVLLDYVFGEVGQFELHVLISIHGSHEVQNLDVNGHEASTWRGDCDVKQEIGIEDICGWCSATPRVINSINAHCEVYAIGVGFFWLVTHDNAFVSYIFLAICWYVGLVDEEDRVCAFHLAWNYLREAFNFVAV